jgi:hypothetical protein
MRAKLSRGEIGGNPPRSSLCRSLLEFFSGQIRRCPGSSSLLSLLTLTLQSLAGVSEILLAASRSVKEKTLDKLLSVPVKDRTPNDVFAQGERSFSGAAPSILRFPQGETRMSQRAAHTNSQSTSIETKSMAGSDRFQLGSFRQDTFFDIAPEGDQKFARQSHNPNPAHPAAAFGKAFAIPATQLTIGLVA